jgi:hypothetical protein
MRAHLLHHAPRAPARLRAPARRAALTVRCPPPRATPDDAPPPAPASDGDAVNATLSALDAVLGIDPNEGKKKEEDAADDDGRRADVSFSPDVLRALADAEAGRAAARGDAPSSSSSSSTPPPSPDALGERMAKLAEAAKRVAAADGDDPTSERELRSEFEKLAALVGTPGGADKADLAAIKEKVFGPRVFWVTEAAPLDPFVADGWLVRGNLRTDRAAAFAAVVDGVAALFGDKYVVLMVDDPALADGGDDGASGRSPDGAPRVAFQIVTAAAAGPPPAPGWQPLAGAVLAALTAGSALQLGMAANVFRLPPEIMAWLADPAGLQAGPDGGLPPFVADFDPTPLLGAALPIAGAVIGVQVAHEVGHAVAARLRGLKAGLPLLVPNGQLGTFGAITQLRSLAPDRAALLDFALAGPAAGAAVAAALFLYGLARSAGGGGGGDVADLIPIPAALFQGSLLLGGVAKAALAGATATKGGALLVHPTLVAGWAGLVATALNCLPVGRLDGGRATLAAFGGTALGIASFLTYVGLALGLLGSALALPFGLYVLICQREPEVPPRDGVSPPSGARQAAAAAAVALALLILLPAAPDVADTVSAGPGMFL